MAKKQTRSENKIFQRYNLIYVIEVKDATQQMRATFLPPTQISLKRIVLITLVLIYILPY